MRALVALGLATGLGAGGLSGCGGDGGGGTGSRAATSTAPGGGNGGSGGNGAGRDRVDPAEVVVIRAWADALRHGDLRGAARRFALPAAVANGTRPIPLDTRAQVVAFNRSLPCGAVLTSAKPAAQGLVVATFRLTERRGPGGGACDGVGERAETAFLIEHGLITHWLRVQDLSDQPGTAA